MTSEGQSSSDLDASGGLLRSALETFEDQFFVLGTEWQFRHWNSAVVETTGYESGDLASMTLPDLVAAEDADRVRNALARALETGHASVEATLLASDDDRTPYEFRIERLTDESGELIGVAGLGSDVTERYRRSEAIRERERVIREIYDVTSDPDRTFAEQVDALLGLGCDVIGTEYGTLSRVREEDDEYHFEAVRAPDDSIQAGDVVPLPETNCERTVKTKQTLAIGDVGRDAPGLAERAGYAEWNIACYLGAPIIVDGEVYGTLCFYDREPQSEGFSDWEVILVDLMSQWVSYELARQRTREQLEQRNEQLEEFASIVSHDLRNPLNVLSGYLELAEETGETAHFERCRRAIERMETLIDDLLTLSRVGEDLSEPEPVDLASVFEGCWRTVETAGATRVVETDQTIRADESRLRQLLENLIRNAVEHGSTSDRPAADDADEHGSTDERPRAGEAEVTITIGDLEDGFYVEDDGPGIPSPEREQVFDAGYSTNEEGTGFGLNIVERIADAHGWDVTITDGTDGGARFEFRGVETA